jgi:hypothetical protein
VDSLKYGDLDVTNRSFDIWDGGTPIRVSLSRGVATVAGLVESGPRAQVVFIPYEESIRATGSQSVKLLKARPTPWSELNVGIAPQCSLGPRRAVGVRDPDGWQRSSPAC